MKIDSKKNDGCSSAASKECLSTVKSLPLSTWHARLGHPCFDMLSLALKSCNIPINDNKVDYVACHLGKKHKLPFCCSQTTYTAPLQLVAADV